MCGDRRSRANCSGLHRLASSRVKMCFVKLADSWSEWRFVPTSFPNPGGTRWPVSLFADVESWRFPSVPWAWLMCDSAVDHRRRRRIERVPGADVQDRSRCARGSYRLSITVCHFPHGTSRWNKVKHRLFAAITSNWRGRPLESHEVVVNLIAERSRVPA